MKKIRDFLSRPVVTVTLFALALVLLGRSTLGGARASLTVESQDYNSQVKTFNIEVALVENGTEVKEDGEDGGKLLKNLLANNGDTALKTGKHYKETLAVKNTGSIDEYVRVSVYKYWLDEYGDKFPDMDSKWIIPGFNEGSWTIDTSSGTGTEERTVLYYSKPLAPDETSDPFMTYVSIDNAAAKQVVQTQKGNVITTTYLYNDKSFCLEVHVDGVQTHSADKAKLSAWGVNK